MKNVPVSLPEHEKLGLLLRRSYVKAAETINEELATMNLDIRQYSVLCQTCNPNHPVNQRELSRRSTILPNRMVALLDSLERRGLIKRTINKRDRRDKLVNITLEGRKLFESATEVVKRSHDKLFTGFSAHDRNLLMKLLVQFTG